MSQYQQAALRRQIHIVFNQIKDELCQMTSGSVFIQIRDNVIGKFGVRYDHIISNAAGRPDEAKTGLSEGQWKSFKQMAIDSLHLKQNWTHGEIIFDFAMRRGALHTSVQMESNYNMARLLQHR